jgi:hypothetical protein
MLKLADIRKTTRRSGKDGLRVIYPRFLRDASLAPRIAMAIRYMDSMLGQPRRALDDEIIVQLFGDHKIARCLVACLGANYRHRPRTLGEVLSPEQVAALAEQGITSASELRLWLFRRVNRELAGFTGGEERAGFLAEAECELGLDAGRLDMLIALDAPEQAMLVRIGPKPAPEDVIARYNYAVTAAVLAQAQQVRVNLTRALSSRDAEAVRTLAERTGVRVELGGRELALYGRQDALESWARHGAKLARLLTMLLLAGLPARGGEALVAAPQGGEWLFRLDGETLGFLGATATPRFDLATLNASQDALEKLLGDAAVLRRAGSLDGWTLRRSHEPLVAEGRLALALCQAVRGDERVALLLAADGSDADAVTLAEAIPLVMVRMGNNPVSPNELCYSARDHLLALPDALEQAIAGAERRMDTARVEAICDETAAAGVLTEPTLAKRLGCVEDEIVQWLAGPITRAACQRRGLEYIEGFGLCTRDMLLRVRRAASEMDEMRANPQVGGAWMMRTLGRRLREVTGAHEGIECLIAWLGAA